MISSTQHRLPKGKLLNNIYYSHLPQHSENPYLQHERRQELQDLSNQYFCTHLANKPPLNYDHNNSHALQYIPSISYNQQEHYQNIGAAQSAFLNFVSDNKGKVEYVR